MRHRISRYALATAVMVITGISSLFAQGSPNVTLLAHLDDYGTYNDCWGYIAPDGREYAFLGVTNGTSIVDITDAPTVNEVTFIPSQTSSWKDIKTYRHWAYTVNETGGGLQIIDLSDLPNSATLVGTYTGFTTSHNIYIDTTNAILYAEGTFGNQSVRVISLADPLNPVELTTFGVECHDIYEQDNRAYIAEGYNGTIGIYDVTNPSSPSLLERIAIPASGYVHNCWTTEDGNYLMSTEETTGKTVKMWDITTVTNPSITDTYLGPTGLAHNVLIKGNFAYISHYADGLRIVDISDPFNIFEVGYYDTHVGGSGYVGAWGTYPFLLNGKVLISDIESGLYVVQFDDGTGGSGIPCEDITSFVGRCVGGGTKTLQFRVNLLNSTIWAGTDVTIDVDGTQYTSTIFSNGTHSRASFEISGVSAGDHTATLIDPDCGLIVHPNCAADGPNAEWDATEALFGEGQFDSKVAPATTRILGNYPNPFNPSTTIRYVLGEDVNVSVRVYNMLGQEVATLVNGFQKAGEQSVVWHGTNNFGQAVSSGLYIYRVQAGSLVMTEKMMFMK